MTNLGIENAIISDGFLFLSELSYIKTVIRKQVHNLCSGEGEKWQKTFSLMWNHEQLSGTMMDVEIALSLSFQVGFLLLTQLAMSILSRGEEEEKEEEERERKRKIGR